jgi:hypothetical protein
MQKKSERNELFFSLPRCRLSYSEIMQTERNAKEKREKRTFLFIAGMPLVLSEDTSENPICGHVRRFI